MSNEAHYDEIHADPAENEPDTTPARRLWRKPEVIFTQVSSSESIFFVPGDGLSNLS